MRAALAAALLAWACVAAADLYRWRDPETGSVKFSSYPPPWFGDPAREGRAPKVEVIPAGKPAASPEPAPEEAPRAGRAAGEGGAKPAAPARSPLEDRRQAVLKQLSATVESLGAGRPGGISATVLAELGLRVREYQAVENALRTTDPAGDAARRADWNAITAAVEGQRAAVLQRLSAIRAPVAGASPDELQSRWQAIGQALEDLGKVDSALRLFDARGEEARLGAARTLAEQLAREWKPLVGSANPGRGD